MISRKPLAKAPARPTISSLCGMHDCSECSGWTPEHGRGRLVPCEHACHDTAVLEAKSA